MPFIPVAPNLRRSLVPSVADVFFCALLLAAFARPAGLQALLADGDTGWHIRTGALVLAAGRAPVTDPFSFTARGRAWTAHEWLSEVVMSLAFRLAQWRAGGDDSLGRGGDGPGLDAGRSHRQGHLPAVV